MTSREIAIFGPSGHFYECPRWHEGRWWASDMRGGRVYSFSQAGDHRVELEIDDRPAGLGWTPDGQLLTVSMERKELLRRTPAGVIERIAMSHLFGEITGFLNDLAVSKAGHIYIGLDYDPRHHDRDAALGAIVHIAPGGEPRIVADGLPFPNGMVFADDGRTLVAAMTMQPKLMGFPILPDGGLGPGTIWAPISRERDSRSPGTTPLPDRAPRPDGCAIDAEDCVWLADVGLGCLRVAKGGAIVDAVLLPDGLRSFACGLGGPDGRTLLICGADDNFADRTSRRESWLFATRVDVPAA